MRNEYLKRVEKIEFVVTDACTGRCKHCSEGEHTACGARLDGQIAADAVRKIASEYEVKTVMVFGGEPLLHTEAVYAIIRAAEQMHIQKRQLITNGYFSRDAETMREVAHNLGRCGVNDLLLSVDAFHQETIPLDVVMTFAREVVRQGIALRLSPAWLVSRTHDNPYNQRTREILSHFLPMGIPVGEGNVVFPEGNARKYLREYFTTQIPENPYVEDPRDVRCISFCANGDVLGANAYQTDILEILARYSPHEKARRTGTESEGLTLCRCRLRLPIAKKRPPLRAINRKKRG